MAKQESKMTTITINSFEPLNVTMPQSAITGDVVILLPPIHIKVKDMSFGGVLPGAHIGADDNLARFSFTLTDGHEMTRAQIMELIDNCLEQLKKVWQLAQNEFDKQFLIP